MISAWFKENCGAHLTSFSKHAPHRMLWMVVWWLGLLEVVSRRQLWRDNISWEAKCCYGEINLIWQMSDCTMHMKKLWILECAQGPKHDIEIRVFSIVQIHRSLCGIWVSYMSYRVDGVQGCDANLFGAHVQNNTQSHLWRPSWLIGKLVHLLC